MKTRNLSAWLSFMAIAFVAIPAFAVGLPVTDGLLVQLDGTSIVSSGTAVTGWNDLASSGGAQDFAPVADIRRPTLVEGGLNGHDTIDFDGADDFLQRAADSAFDSTTGHWATFVVLKPESISGNHNVLRTGYGDIDPGATTRSNTSTWGLWLRSSGFNYHGRNPGGSYRGVGSAGNPADGNWHIQSGTLRALIDPSVLQWVDGQPAGSTVSDTTTYLSGHIRTHIGANSNHGTAPNEPYNGQIAEVLMYDKTLSDFQRRSVEGYLNVKYGFVDTSTLLDGLALYTSFDAGTPSLQRVITQDVSGNGHHATNENALAIDDSAADAARDSVIDYSGNTSLRTEFGNVLNPGTDDFSVSLWLNADAAHGFDFVASHGNAFSSNGGWAIHLVKTPTDSTINIRGANVDASKWSVGGAALTPGDWQHFTMVVDRGSTDTGSGVGGIVRGYLGGVEYGTAPINSTAAIDGQGKQMLFGMRNDLGTGNSFDGMLDDVRIYQGTSLTPAQVADLATNVDVPGATAHYDFSLNQPTVLNPADAADDFGGKVGTIVGNVPGAFPADTLVGDASIDFQKSDADYVSYGNVLDPGTGSYTASVWFKLDGVAGTQFIASKGNAGSSNDGWSIWEDGGNLNVRADFVGSNDGTDRLGLRLGGALTADQWHHVALVIDQDTGRLIGYLDGAGSGIAGTDNGWTVGGNGGVTNVFVGPRDFTAGNPLLLGRRSSNSAAMDGQMDEFAVWNRALGADEINAFYQSGLAGVAVPEPATAVLLLLGAVAMIACFGRRK